MDRESPSHQLCRRYQTQTIVAGRTLTLSVDTEAETVRNEPLTRWSLHRYWVLSMNRVRWVLCVPLWWFLDQVVGRRTVCPARTAVSLTRRR